MVKRSSLILIIVFLLFPSILIAGDGVTDYWERPVPLQKGDGSSLYPEECGKCHKDQYNDWKGSFHSKSVGPGLIGQLKPHEDPEFALSCYFCHAPMEEQSEMKKGSRVKPAPAGSKQGGQGLSDYIKNPNFDNKLKLSGVSCSVCHFREGKVYGPPARARVKGQGSGFKISNLKSQIKKTHNGFVEKAFFENAEFCAACHQLDEGYELNGKVLTNTYREWKESIYGKNNVICQNCHMPDRQHLWRGIHDPEMVKKGITIDAAIDWEKAKLVITNTGVGHYFPTYATPLVVVKGYMQDKKGSAIPESVKIKYIGRRVSLDLSDELFDTRIPPHGKFEFTYEVNRIYNKHRPVFEVWVYPDEFYNRFYKEVLNNQDVSIKKEEIEKALHITEKSGYMLFRKVL